VSYVLVGIVAVLAIVLGVVFNQLIAKRQMVKNGWADIDVQLKRRADLAPQLVSVVQGYAAHERQLFEDIAAKRTQALAAGDDPAKRGETETEFSRPIGKLIAVAEAYPELKASQNFLELQNALADTENKIEMARRFYNGAVRELNTAVETVPGNLVAGLAGVHSAPFFQIGAGEAAVPQVAISNS
jgi:LemA protein